MHLSASREIKVTVSGGRGNRAVPGSPPKALPAHKSMPSVGSGAGGSFGGLSKTRSGLMSSPMAPLGGTSDEDDDTSEASPASSSGLINHQSSSFDDAFGRNLVDQYGDAIDGIHSPKGSPLAPDASNADASNDHADGHGDANAAAASAASESSAAASGHRDVLLEVNDHVDDGDGDCLGHGHGHGGVEDSAPELVSPPPCVHRPGEALSLEETQTEAVPTELMLTGGRVGVTITRGSHSKSRKQIRFQGLSALPDDAESDGSSPLGAVPLRGQEEFPNVKFDNRTVVGKTKAVPLIVIAAARKVDKATETEPMMDAQPAVTSDDAADAAVAAVPIVPVVMSPPRSPVLRSPPRSPPRSSQRQRMGDDLADDSDSDGDGRHHHHHGSLPVVSQVGALTTRTYKRRVRKRDVMEGLVYASNPLLYLFNIFGHAMDATFRGRLLAACVGQEELVGHHAMHHLCTSYSDR